MKLMRRLISRLAWMILLSSLSVAYSQQRSATRVAQRRDPSASNQPVANPSVTELERLFQNPPDDSKIMVRWWWFGPAVTRAELEREMRVMKEGGIGGFEVQPVYPLLPDDPAIGIKNLPFLSDEHIDALRFVAAKRVRSSRPTRSIIPPRLRAS